MVDTVTPEVRSRMMAAVKSRDTKPEMALRRALHAMGFRYRVHAKVDRARPDIVLPKYRAAVFVHGCFWHAHDHCRLARLPKSNVGFWTEKLDRNAARDARNMADLAQAGWRTAVVWECAVRDGDISMIAEELAAWLRGGDAVDLEVRGGRFDNGGVPV